MGDSLAKASEFDAETVQISLAEMGEHVAAMENDILAMEGGESGDPDRINRIFRAAHTLKGTAAFMGMARVQRLSHDLENMLGRIRDGGVRPDMRICDLLLRGTERLRALLDPDAPVDDAAVDELAAAIAALLTGPSGVSAIGPASAAGEQPSRSWTPASPAAIAGADATANPNPATAPPPAGPGDAQAPAKADGHIRVNVVQLDKLMALAGELVLTRNALLQSLSSGNPEALAGAAQRVDSLTSEIQDGIMLTRMQPIGSAFGRFRRLVRDLARQLGKRIELEIEGEEVEIDKSVLEAIGDPLVHLVRNAADHGIEPPAQRAAAGKPEAGRLRLRARHAAGKVRIEIEDDGAGIDPERIKAKALEKGLRTQAELAAMNDKELAMLIFTAGFSTAGKVTDVSGRGVGLDVVLTGLAKVGGTVEIESRPGCGTLFRISLPLTLAIIPSLLVRAGDERYALPQAGILELVRIARREAPDRLPRLGDAAMIRLRGEFLPLAGLDEALGLPASAPQPAAEEEAVHVAIVAAGELKYGLRVDAFLDSMEIVVKPFGRHLAKCTRYAGATILGDGQVALILDVAGIGKALGMERIPSAAEAAGNPPAGTDPEGQAPGCEYLVVEDGGGGSFALPLDRVLRIERIPAGGIAAVGCKLAYSHSGGCLALLAPGAPAADVPRGSGKAAYAAVFQAGGAEYGLLVSEILDIVRAARDADAARFAQPGFLGAVRVGERFSLVPDLDELAARATRGEMETDMRRSS